MRQEIAKILSNKEISKDIYKMEIQCEMASEAKPGQFIEITVPPFFLRRPISISEIKEDSIVIIYKILGEGTEKMTRLHGRLDIFGPLGHGFEIEDKEHVVLVGGGVGVPPLYQTAIEYLKKGTKVDVVLGFNDKETIFYEEEFKALGCNVYIATMDGSYGSKGTVINAIEDNQVVTDFVCSCGPLPMLKAVQDVFESGYISLEARMACGMGACMGCVVKDQEGHSLRVCKDGPVFPIGKVVL
ncbi:MAG: dihydroorotate dehydrogenase electron transfer subunit [Bacillota bacterium]|nr:dihydroorotate dehydrogenase electron transfer subunit [Bacillota bacterium]